MKSLKELKKAPIQVHTDLFTTAYLLDIIYREIKTRLSKKTKNLIISYYEDKKEFNSKYDEFCEKRGKGN
jgi:hypothetical protein